MNRTMQDTHDGVRVRFPPSPTGAMHLGNIRTAIFNHLFARHHGGTFILRIEDTDAARSKKEYEKDILASLAWLAIPYDEFHRQSERAARHQECLERMIQEERAYLAEENQDGTGRVVRFKNPKKTVTFHDLIRGDISFDTTELGDFVIARAPDRPLYHLAVVVDDADMRITHIIRGEDHISNTPRQMLLQEALGAAVPQYAHLPLVLAQDKTKLSKRSGSLSIAELRAHGYLPDAVVNYLALLGWHPEDDREIFTREELVAAFDLSRVQTGAAIFDPQKLRWVNKQHLALLSDEAFEALLHEYLNAHPLPAPLSEHALTALLPLLRERLEVFADMETLAREGEFDFLRKDFSLSEEEAEALVFPKACGKAGARERAARHLEEVACLLEALPEEAFTPEKIKDALWSYAEQEGRGEVLWPMRYALSGRARSFDPFSLAAALGKEETLRRLGHAAKLAAKP